MQLASALKEVARSNPISPAVAAERYAEAYDSYAIQAVPPGVYLGAKERLRSVLYNALMNPRAGTPQLLATTWSQAVGAYWLGPPPVHAPNPVVYGGAPVILIGLVQVFSTPSSSLDVASSRFAQVLDAGTRLVVVTIVGTPTPLS